jgi:ABC-type nitrate/sulfonate/bicarbonate transport system substrate-binding protein
MIGARYFVAKENGTTGRVKKGKPLIWMGAALGVVCAGTLTYLWYHYDGAFQHWPASVETLTIAIGTLPLSAPVYVALDRGYFQKEGLRVNLKEFATGKEALETLLAGKADMATCAETPIMMHLMTGGMGKFYVIASLADSETMCAIVARKDRCISRSSNLKGKTIGMTPGTNGEYFLYAFLLFHGVSEKAVKVVGLEPHEMREALLKGNVDAVATWEPHVSQSREGLGEKGGVHYLKGFYRMTWDLVGTASLIGKRPDTIKKVLTALVKAERYIVENPEEAVRITAGRLGQNTGIKPDEWKKYYFRITLPQSLLISLEDQARWAKTKGLLQPARIPNFLHSLYPDGLRAVRPDAVTSGD